jgi:RecA/RadA recombinase
VDKETKRLKQTLKAPPRAVRVRRTGLSSGSTVLNLACTGRPDVAFYPGHFYFFVGDSSSGKTFLTLTTFAEASINEAFKDYRLIFDNVEDGALMDFAKFFGAGVAARVEAPSASGENSTTIEDFYYNWHDACLDGRPFIYVLDSMDALSSVDEAKKFNEHKKSRNKAGKAPAGSFGDGKAKKNSQNLRMILRLMKKTGSILIIICQTRENIGFGAMFEPKTRAGGKSLKFYATLEMWTSVAKRLSKKLGDRTYKVGMISRIDVKKNRVQGKERTVDQPILYEIGIDDVGGCLDYLVSTGAAKQSESGVITFGEMKGHRSKLITAIETSTRGVATLRTAVGAAWKAQELKLETGRKPRYE